MLRGYGLADVQTAKPVDAQRTIFQVGSLSKPVTAMGVVKLSQDHGLDRNEDLSRLLPELPERATAVPITLHQMLTHTSGFDPVFVDIGVDDPTQLLDLAHYIHLRAPPRTMTPGQFILYNNFGFSLAGRVIERVSGLTFADYMRRAIFEPLDMRNSSFSPRDYATLAHGHDWVNGSFVPVHPLYLNDTPAGGLTTTAGDMAKFLIAALGGPEATHAILSDQDLQCMHHKQFAHHPAL